MDIKQGFDFDDVLVLPIMSEINSRSEVDISVKLSDNLVLDFPVIASPMLNIVDASFAIKLSELGGIAILHRMYDDGVIWFKEIATVKHAGAKLGIAMGLDNDFEPFITWQPDILVVDVANGYTKELRRKCEQIKNHIIKYGLDTLLMAGNVVTPDGATELIDSGVDLVRVGIGGGSLCSTRNVTGIGSPQITAISDCLTSTKNGGKLVADGGIRISGDAVKAFVAGADVVMIGSLFAQTYESPSKDVIFGMASKRLQEMHYTQIKSVEGIEKNITKKWSLKEFVDNFSWGVKSAGTYLNAKTLTDFRKYGTFIQAGKNSIKDIKEVE